MPSHFVAELTPNKGPDPVEEIEALLAGAPAEERGQAVFGTRMAGTGWEWTNPAFAIIFFRKENGTLDGAVAEILSRFKAPPANVPALYAPWMKTTKGWWELRSARRFKPGLTLADIPGRSLADAKKDATKTFNGQVSFAYWDLEKSPVRALTGE